MQRFLGDSATFSDDLFDGSTCRSRCTRSSASYLHSSIARTTIISPRTTTERVVDSDLDREQLSHFLLFAIRRTNSRRIKGSVPRASSIVFFDRTLEFLDDDFFFDKLRSSNQWRLQILASRLQRLIRIDASKLSFVSTHQMFD